MTDQKEPVSTLLDAVQAIKQAHLNGVENLLKNPDIAEAVAQIGAIQGKYGLTGEKHFNFFTSISDLYTRENFHSDILATILDPHTKDIGNIEYLRSFVTLITASLKKSGKAVPDNTLFDKETTTVEREKGKIDIFIHDAKKCIIGENKINNATDMDNQLARYAEKAKNWGLQILAVVYIPPIGSSSKKPPFEEYSEKYKHYLSDIEKKLVLLPVFLPASGDDKGEILDITHGFLDKIADINPENITAKVYIQQYSNLLKGLEEDAMSSAFELDVLKRLLETEESRKTAAEIAEVWNNRGTLLFDECKKALCEKGFAENACLSYFGKRVLPMYGICVYGADGQMGFGDTEKNMSEEVQAKLKTILTQKVFSDLHPSEVISTSEWVYFDFMPDALSGSLNDRVKKLVDCYEFLETEARKVLD